MRRESFNLSWLGSAIAVLLAAIAYSLTAASREGSEVVSRLPRIKPDYSEIVLPPNIAPLNFAIDEPEVVRHRVRLISAGGKLLEVSGRSGSVQFPLKRWQELLGSSRGQALMVEVSVQDRQGVWKQFQRITNTVSSDSIDGHLVYRLLRPVYNVYGPLGIYQRDIGNFKETPLIENRSIEDGCLNCHTFQGGRPETMAMHIRHKGAGNPMLLVRSNDVTRVDKTSGYISWHPSGRLLAYSVNKFTLLFHTTGETRDLFDSASDLGIYRVDSNTVVTPPAISKPERLETWPSWAPDGKHLYFCSAPRLKMERFKQVRYDLMRVAYDIDRDQWGEPEVVVSARETRMSAAQPRISPDGKWLLFCLAPYGNFPAYHPGSDLYLKNLESGEMRRLEINSEQSDSWHCWSSNSRWIVFSSKRGDQLFTRPYFSHVDEQGNCSKPILLPQRDPFFYDSFVNTYNVPELIQGPVTVSARELARGALNPRNVLKPLAAAGDSLPPEHEAEEGRGAMMRKEPGGRP
jgi:hypothetical protein